MFIEIGKLEMPILLFAKRTSLCAIGVPNCGWLTTKTIIPFKVGLLALFEPVSALEIGRMQPQLDVCRLASSTFGRRAW